MENYLNEFDLIKNTPILLSLQDVIGIYNPLIKHNQWRKSYKCPECDDILASKQLINCHLVHIHQASPIPIKEKYRKKKS